jgi:hypothetical protein
MFASDEEKEKQQQQQQPEAQQPSAGAPAQPPAANGVQAGGKAGAPPSRPADTTDYASWPIKELRRFLTERGVVSFALCCWLPQSKGNP